MPQHRAPIILSGRMMTHETKNLVGYLDGGLQPEVHGRVERHLQACHRCRSELAQLRSARRALESAGHHAPVPAFDTELWTRVHSQISRPHPAPRLQPRWALATGAFALAAAAVCLALIDGRVTPGASHGQLAAKPDATVMKGKPGATRSPGGSWDASPMATRETSPDFRKASGSSHIVPAPPSDARRRLVQTPGTDHLRLSEGLRRGASTPAYAAPRSGAPNTPVIELFADDASRARVARTRIATPKPYLMPSDRPDTNLLHDRLDVSAVDGDRPTRRMAKIAAAPETLVRPGGLSDAMQRDIPAAPAAPLPASAGAMMAKAGALKATELAAAPDVTGAPARGPLGTATGNGSLDGMLPATTFGTAVRPDEKSNTPNIGLDIVPGPPANYANPPANDGARIVEGQRYQFDWRSLSNPQREAVKARPAPAESPRALVTVQPLDKTGRRYFEDAQTAFRRGRKEEAASGFRKALAAGVSATDQRIAHLRLGDAAVQAKDDRTALLEYTAAIEIGKDAEVLLKLGGVYERLGDLEKARNAYQQALLFNQGQIDARAGLARLKSPKR